MLKRHSAPSASPESVSNDGLVGIGELNRSLGFTLRRAQLSIYKDFGKYMNTLSVRPSQFAVLVLIRENPGFSQSAISLKLGIQKANFVSLLDELEARGLVERKRSQEDRRTFALHLTKQGEVFMKRVLSAHRSLEKSLVDRLGEKDSGDLLRLLNKFADAANGAS